MANELTLTQQEKEDLYADATPTEPSIYDDPVPEQAPPKPEVEAFDMRAAVLIRMGRTGEDAGEALRQISGTYITANLAALQEAETYTMGLEQDIPKAVTQQVEQAGSQAEVEEILTDGSSALAQARSKTDPIEVAYDAIEQPPVHPLDVVTNEKHKKALAANARMAQALIDVLPEETMAMVRDGAATVIDFMVGTDQIDMKKVAEKIGMDTSASVGPFGKWAGDFGEYWRNYVIKFKQLPVEQQEAEFFELLDYVADEQTGLQTMMLMEQLLRPGSEFELDQSILDPYNQWFMAADQLALLGTAISLPVKLYRRTQTASTVSHALAQLRETKRAFELLDMTADMKEDDIAKVLGGSLKRDGVVGSLDPVAGNATADAIPVSIVREQAERFDASLNTLEKMGAIGPKGVSVEQAATIAQLDELLDPATLRQKHMFEKAFTPANMQAGMKQAIIDAHKRGTDTTIDHVVFKTDEYGSLTGEVELYVSDLQQPLDGMMRIGKNGDLEYLSGTVDDQVRVKFVADDLRYNDITGSYEITGGTFRDSAGNILSPLGSSLSVAEADEVRTALRLDNTSKALENDFVAAWKVATSPLSKNPIKNKKSMERLNKVLTDGDEWIENGVEVSKEFTRKELDALYDLTEAEKETYFNIRHIVKLMHTVKDSEARSSYVKAGFVNINIPALVGAAEGVSFEGRSKNMGKVINNVKELLAKPNTLVYDVTQQSEMNSFSVGKYWNTNEYLKGKKLVRLHSGSRRGLNPSNKSKSYEYIIVDENMVEDLPPSVLSYRAGMMPRTYQRSNYFVRQFDAQGNFIRTLRRFDNNQEAEAFAADLKAGKFGGKSEYTYSAQSEGEFMRMNQDEMLFDGVGGTTDSLYTSARAANKIPFGHPERRLRNKFGRSVENTDRDWAMRSLQQQMSALSTHLPRNEWRMGMEQKMRNTIREMLGPEAANDWGGLRSPVPRHGNLELADALEFRRKKFEKLAGIHDANEEQWQKLTRRLYEWAVRKPDGSLPREVFGEVAWWLNQHDPFKIARGFAFHTLLGFGRVDQVWVQAQGAANAAAMNILRPDKILKFTDMQRWVNAGLHMSDAQLSVTAKKIIGVDEQEFKDMVALYRRTGLAAGVEMNADFQAASKGYSLTGAAVNRALEAGLIPYYAGERFNRGFSFLTALDEFQTGKRTFNGQSLKGMPLSQYTDEMVNALHSRANDFMLNLGRSNAARWQENYFSVTTQFVQIQAKLYETLTGAGGGFTGAERLRMGVAQLALYGAAGIPAGQYIVGLAMNRFFENEDEFAKWAEENKTEMMAASDGFWGALFYSAFGAELSVGSRGSVLKSIEDAYMRIREDSEVDIAEVLLGPFGAFMQEVPGTTKQLYDLTLTGAAKKDLTKAEMMQGVTALGRLFATGRKAEKAYIMQQFDQSVARSGNVMWVGDSSLGTEISTAMGFTPKRDTMVFTMSEAARAEEEKKQKVTKKVVRYMHDYVVALSRASYGDIGEEKAAELNTRVAALVKAAYPDSEDMQADILKSAFDRISNPETAEDRAIKAFIRTSLSGSLNDFLDRSKLSTAEAKAAIGTGE